ncbi:hypothetical protein GPECTOR_331g58 [Gonium pectorale]|uniref:Uncharacterized protein n=1 Tax=Gonium pectorale TaxID=33097 RepID=A0A150FVQ6_GONPE|nr:hypothetical protein GPECTOR_331g58 [Gonium pectorale]|eukprot:KXZ41667.1 hypothetical protein GPECTOR_331g58 [Gonium pectorale]
MCVEPPATDQEIIADPGHCPLLSVPGFDAQHGLHYDPMHTCGGVIKDILDLLLNSSRVKDAVLM